MPHLIPMKVLWSLLFHVLDHQPIIDGLLHMSEQQLVDLLPLLSYYFIKKLISTGVYL